MAILDIQVKLSGLRLKDLPGIVDEALRQAKDESATVLLNRNRTRFQQEEDPDGKKWPPSKSALKRKAGGFTFSNGRKVTGGGTLFASGRLFHSITLGRSGQDRKVFTTVPYAASHHFGQGQVERRIIGASEADLLIVERVLARQLEKELRRGS